MSYINVAKEAAEKAGKIAMKHFGKELKIESKKHESDIVTEVDKEADAVIVETIRSKYPDHDILTEESGHMKKGSNVTWVVDPIDGTQNYAQGLPLFAISIAVIEDGKIVASALNLPAFNELYTAERGKGAFLNGKPIKVSDESKLRMGLVIQEQKANSEDDVLKLMVQHQKAFSHKVGALRNFGSAVVQLAWTAKGHTVAFVDEHTHIWDVAAGILLVEEAGGKVTTLDNKPWKPVLDDEGLNMIASNGLVHADIVEILKNS